MLNSLVVFGNIILAGMQVASEKGNKKKKSSPEQSKLVNSRDGKGEKEKKKKRLRYGCLWMSFCNRAQKGLDSTHKL